MPLRKVLARDRKDVSHLIAGERIGFVDGLVALTQIPAKAQRGIGG